MCIGAWFPWSGKQLSTCHSLLSALKRPSHFPFPPIRKQTIVLPKRTVIGGTKVWIAVKKHRWAGKEDLVGLAWEQLATFRFSSSPGQDKRELDYSGWLCNTPNTAVWDITGKLCTWPWGVSLLPKGSWLIWGSIYLHFGWLIQGRWNWTQITERFSFILMVWR